MHVRYLTLATLALSLVASTALAEDKEKPKADEAKGLLENPEKLFSKIDSDGDKKVSKEEFTKFLEKLPKIGEKAAQLSDRLFGRLDADKDDKLSLDEFKKIADFKDRIDPEKRRKPKEDSKKDQA